MKKIFTLALLVFSLTGFSQTFQRVDGQTQIVRRDCELIVITTDSLVSSNMRSLPEMLEEVTCYSSNSDFKSTALMFWFKIEADDIVQRSFNNLLVKIN
jgi:hypothetical protein